MRELANDWIADLMAYEPGKPLEEVARELGMDDHRDIHKLASNENALGPSPMAVAAMQAAAAEMHIYPDGGAFALRRAIAAKLDLHEDEVMLGNGSNELIVFLSHVFLRPGRNIVMSDKAFVIYRLAASLYQADTIAVPMRDYSHDLEAMVDAITPETRLLYVANPNNPTGTMVSQAELDRLMERVPEHVVTVFDEAYIDLLPPAEQPDTLKYLRAGRNVFILRSFSKSYGLAGLRIGYALSARAGIELLHHVRQPFNVNAMAQAGALAALEDEQHLAETRSMIAAGLEQLRAGLREIGVDFIDSKVNFLLVRSGRGREVFHELQRRKVIVRPMDGYGMPDMIRVTVGTREQNERFIEQLKQVLQQESE
jgi:histidinol-phosphate aminotransferase